MTAAGWAFLLVSLGFVWGLAGWCYGRLLRDGERGVPSGQDSLEHDAD